MKTQCVCSAGSWYFWCSPIRRRLQSRTEPGVHTGSGEGGHHFISHTSHPQSGVVKISQMFYVRKHNLITEMSFMFFLYLIVPILLRTVAIQVTTTWWGSVSCNMARRSQVSNHSLCGLWTTHCTYWTTAAYKTVRHKLSVSVSNMLDWMIWVCISWNISWWRFNTIKAF